MFQKRRSVSFLILFFALVSAADACSEKVAQQAKSQVKVVVLMGVSGTGKSTVGEALAKQVGWKFIDADDFHSAASKAKMHAGQGLTDADRAPWLQAVRKEIDRELTGTGAVIACSALRRDYRKNLGLERAAIRLVYLHGTEALLKSRLENRQGHFAKSSLLPTQLKTLEPPTADENALWVDVKDPLEKSLQDIRAAIF